MNRKWIAITGTRFGIPTAATCSRCRATWVRPDDDPQADTLVIWARAHDCRDALPAWLAGVDGPDAAVLASELHGVALDLLHLGHVALAAQGELIGNPDEAAFWRATGRHDGLCEAHNHVLQLVEGLTRRGGLG